MDDDLGNPERKKRRRLRRIAVIAATGLATAGVLTLAVDRSGSHIDAAPVAKVSDTPSASASPASPDAALTRALNAVTAEGDYQVAALDLDSGDSASYAHGDSGTYDTASIVKVDILATLLLQAQDSGTALTPAQRTLATSMIENSDNDATNTLWGEIGGASGLDAANKTLGLTDTVGGTDGDWGLTQTTAEDQITLLEAVYGDDSPLSADSQTYVQGLMGNVEADQQWGVSAAADSGSSVGLKNGWLQRSATDLWDINSVGEVTVGGDSVLIAVTSSGSSTESAGIGLVETVAEAAGDAVVA
ncbi:serine hydrolase [Streptomyces beijiangensis]|uniref:Serine hydrolase n=1 Tax=Streptomyces beijiangensis TaxID=163361 RepID=A0A939F193_9ACTN|nr:serine hydrolase [Streptomyces beijiangensis]MBO0510292.1 serine hydrolase [Streptomyces beijiangensis]